MRAGQLEHMARGKAYFAGCSLEGQAKGHWSMEAVEQAKRRAGW